MENMMEQVEQAKLQAMISGKETFTLTLDDPAGNSYLQNVWAPDPDPEMHVEEYQRSWEQNEELGLNDMKAENYQQDYEEVHMDSLEAEGESLRKG